MTLELSAFVDGETEAAETAAVLVALHRDEELRRRWDAYQLVGAALRGEEELHADLAPKVMAGLRSEPVVLAPRRPSLSRPRRSAWMALAASAAGVAFGLWLALTPSGDAPPPTLAAAARPAPLAQGQGRIQEYLVAHQTYSPGINPQGGTRYIRTVASARETAR